MQNHFYYQPQMFVSEIPPDSIFLSFSCLNPPISSGEACLSVKMSRPLSPRVQGWHHLSLLRGPAWLPQAPEGDGGAERLGMGYPLSIFRYI